MSLSPLAPSHFAHILTPGDTRAGLLTPESMMVYIETRLSSLDDKMQDLMARQKEANQLREKLGAVKTALSHLSDDGGKLTREQAEALTQALNELRALSPQIAAEVKSGNSYGKWMVFNGETKQWQPRPDAEDVKVNKQQLAAMKAELDNMISNVESTAQLDMIELQSLMSGRNTAISLATNLISSLGKGMDSVASNIGR